MIGNVLWFIGFIVLVVCIVIQRRALNKIAFGRSMFITGMSFLCSFIVAITPPSPEVWVLFAFFQALAWVFLVFMTLRSWRHIQVRQISAMNKTRG